MGNLLKHNRLSAYSFPMYLPDATLGVARGLTSFDLKKIGIQGVVVNTYHLRERPGLEILNQVGGIKKLMNWNGLVTSDSGGFQLFSLINKNPKLGKITDEGVVLYSGKNQQRKELFTPEDSIRLQFAIGSDIVVCLDDFTPPEADQKRVVQSVQRTVDWARRSKLEFERQLQIFGFSEEDKPLLLAPIQGHNNYELRNNCTQELVKIGFDIYGLGGWPFLESGEFDYEMCQKTRSYLPPEALIFALGVGAPENVTRLYQMGYHFFDCVLPTRDARHKRLYVFADQPEKLDLFSGEDWYKYLYFDRGALKNDLEPISPHCDCFTCQNYSRAYLHHLFKIKDSTAFRLASIHNLSFYARLMEVLQKKMRS